MGSRHGDPNRYDQGCRCPKCTKAKTEHVQAGAVKRSKLPKDKIPHGRRGYTNYLCRCPICTKAQEAYDAARGPSRGQRKPKDCTCEYKGGVFSSIKKVDPKCPHHGEGAK